MSVTSYLYLSLGLFSVEPLRSSAVDSLFVLDLHGNLTEYVLEPQGVKTVPQSDDTPLELITTARAQWAVTRYNWVKRPIALYKFFSLFFLNFTSHQIVEFHCRSWIVFLKNLRMADQSDETCLFFNQSGVKPKPIIYGWFSRFPALGAGCTLYFMFQFAICVCSDWPEVIPLALVLRWPLSVHRDNFLASVLVFVLTVVFVALLGAQLGLKARVP